MAVMTEIKNPIELRKAGMKALVNAIGHDNAQEFVRRCRGTPGWDFGQWLNEQPEPTDDAFFAEIERAQAEARATGVPDCTR
jgi:hypothetical protein